MLDQAAVERAAEFVIGALDPIAFTGSLTCCPQWLVHLL